MSILTWPGTVLLNYATWKLASPLAVCSPNGRRHRESSLLQVFMWGAKKQAYWQEELPFRRNLKSQISLWSQRTKKEDTVRTALSLTGSQESHLKGTRGSAVPAPPVQCGNTEVLTPACVYCLSHRFPGSLPATGITEVARGRRYVPSRSHHMAPSKRILCMSIQFFFFKGFSLLFMLAHLEVRGQLAGSEFSVSALSVVGLELKSWLWWSLLLSHPASP